MKLIASRDNRWRPARIRDLAVGFAALGLVAGCSVAGASTSPTTMASASPSPRITASAAPAEASSLEPSAPTPEPSAASFTTSGVTSNWTGFSWSRLPPDNPLVTADPGVKVLAWRGGYAAYGTTNGGSSAVVWTSVDGEKWTQIAAIAAPQVLIAASPAGLVAVGRDPSAATPWQTVWTSSDGVHWRNAGSPTGLGFLDSVAGTSAGLVATGHTLNGSGKFATQTFSVAFSTDGVSWTPVEVQPGITWDEVGPQVQSGNNRFFVMGGSPAGQASNAAYRLDALDLTGGPGGRGLVGASTQGNGGLWWSDDGRTWTRSSFGGYYASQIDVGRDGMILWTASRQIPGNGPDLEVSRDGGKTWVKDSNFGPLGLAACDVGACMGIANPDGVIGSNGTIFVAVKTDGHAWVSYDGKTWSPVAWNSSFPGYSLVLPRGVVAGNAYGAAK